MNWKIAIVAAVLGVLAAGFALAQGFRGWNSTDMQEIIQSGTYEDLVQYREESGFNMMPWVDDAEDFALAKQMHQRMYAWREANPDAAYGGCPMHGRGAKAGGCQGGCRNAP
jgi:hypothetical protein